MVSLKSIEIFVKNGNNCLNNHMVVSKTILLLRNGGGEGAQYGSVLEIGPFALCTLISVILGLLFGPL